MSRTMQFLTWFLAIHALLTLLVLGDIYRRFGLWEAPQAFTAAGAPRPEHETAVAARLAQQLDGVAEHRLPGGTRVDILLPDAAIECDWADKWAEGIGQAAYYGRMTGRRPVTLLFLSDPPKQNDYVERARVAATSVPGLEVWTYDLQADKLEYE